MENKGICGSVTLPHMSFSRYWICYSSRDDIGLFLDPGPDDQAEGLMFMLMCFGFSLVERELEPCFDPDILRARSQRIKENTKCN
jgi:hypothetical protein